MNKNTFYFNLLGVTLSIVMLLTLLHIFFPPAQIHWQFSCMVTSLFVLISIGLFHAGQSTAKSKNKLAFNNIISLSVLGKMVLSVVLLFLYREGTKPENGWFVIIFLLVYSVYTIFEVVFMTKLAKS
jgi:hypothetical protein